MVRPQLSRLAIVTAFVVSQLTIGVGLVHAQVVASVKAYSAKQDRQTYSKPALPQLRGAGSTFTDPAFGSRMARVTDANTRPGHAGQSYTTPSAAHQNAWNTTSTYFYVRSVDGYFVPYAFNPSSMAASRIGGSDDGGLLISSQTEPQFSFVS